MISEMERTLAGLLGSARPPVLFEAMRHAVMGGGKRIRPQLCLAAAEAAGGRRADALYPACAIELLHCYTLVHDDLPAMDGDAQRRGKPSVWAKYGEATAILAGDALQALAFQTAARAPRHVEKVLAALGDAAVGVVRGQAEELAHPSIRLRQGYRLRALRYGGQVGGQALTPHLSTTHFIYRHKTADLFVAAAAMGAYAGGGEEGVVAHLRTYALNLGLAFQHEDDLLDGDSPYPEEETKRLIAQLTAAALAALDGLPGDTVSLSALAERLAARKV